MYRENVTLSVKVIVIQTLQWMYPYFFSSGILQIKTTLFRILTWGHYIGTLGDTSGHYSGTLGPNWGHYSGTLHLTYGTLMTLLSGSMGQQVDPWIQHRSTV